MAYNNGKSNYGNNNYYSHGRNRNRQRVPQQEPPNTVYCGYAVTVVHDNSATDNNVLKPVDEKQRQQDFANMLECPVCMTLPEKEIFNCEMGHSVCKNCRNQMHQCAYCKHPYTASRNFALESVVSYFKKHGNPTEENKPVNTLLSCENKPAGCTKTDFNKCNLAIHEKECEYRRVRCKVATNPKCPWDTSVKLNEYFTHLLEHHNISGLAEPSGFFTKIDRLFIEFEINTNWPVFYLHYDGKTFLRYASIRNRRVSWWIQLIGPDSESKKYRAVISIYSPDKPEKKISWSVPVYPLRANKPSIDDDNIAVISPEQMKPFCSINKPFEDRIATYTWICHIALSRLD